MNPALVSTALGVVPPQRSGMASGINNTFRQVGIATGIAALGAPAERARVAATIYVVCYLSFSLPAIAAGVVVTHSNLHDASLGYAAFVGALGALAAASAIAQRASHKRPAPWPGVHSLPPTPCAAPMAESLVVDRYVAVSVSSTS